MDLQKLRGQIAVLKDEIAGFADAPLTEAEARQRIKHRVATLDVEAGQVARGAASFANLDGAFLPDCELKLSDVAAIIGRDALAAALFEIAKPFCAGGVSIADRAKRRTEAMRELKALETAEERHILDASKKGITIDRRADADAGLLLELWS